jgi:hypothetical protein
MEMRDEPAPSRRSRVGGEEQLWVGTRGRADNPPGRAKTVQPSGWAIFLYQLSTINHQHPRNLWLDDLVDS